MNPSSRYPSPRERRPSGRRTPRRSRRSSLAALATLLIAPVLAAGDLPPNEWVRLGPGLERPYVYARPVGAPVRERVLWWGAVEGGDAPRNDVLVFDPARGQWVPDKPSTDAETLRDARSRGLGVGVKEGRGAMLEDGTPAPSYVVHGVTYDTKRDRITYVLNGLTAAYDPETREWRALGSQTELWDRLAPRAKKPYGMYERGLPPEVDLAGKRVPGGPPVYGPGACYDPVNDAIVLFPHWGGQNTDRRPVDGRVSSHAGTFVFRFEDRVWRRVSHRLGSAGMRRERRRVLEWMRGSDAPLEGLWTLGPGAEPDAMRGAADALQAVARRVQAAAPGLERAADERIGAAASALEHAADAAREGHRRRAIRSGGDALRVLDGVLRDALRVEPPPRCAAPMVYDARNEAIVLFSGQSNLVRTDLEAQGRDPEPGALDDTWLYDVREREWREAPCARRPPPQRVPLLAYDDETGRVLLVTLTREDHGKRVALWSFDAARRTWRRHHEAPWEGRVDGWSGLAFDAARRTLLLTQGGTTYGFRVALDALPSEPPPVREPEPPIRPHRVPPDDPEWVAELEGLPPNEWVHTRPPRDADSRNWGIAACDAERGKVHYFGGGHATYQVNDVAVYAVGANRWAHAAGHHNDFVPPVHWDGQAMGFAGGPPAGHQRNSYVALDGRLFVSCGTHSRRWDAEIAKRPGTRVAWFYDLDRGSVWRQKTIAGVDLGEGVPGSYGRVHVVDPEARVIYGFAGHLEPYDGRFFDEEAYLSAYDVDANTLAVRRIPEPTPGWVGECRPFCMLPERGGIFFYEYREDGGHRTWIYDIAQNRFRNLEPARQPPAAPRTVVHIPGQDAVFAVIGEGTQWVYSFARNTWAPLPLRSDGPLGFARPYAQVAYVERHGVLVNTGHASRGVAVMRPDASAAAWRR